jgi:hypothetical protein
VRWAPWRLESSIAVFRRTQDLACTAPCIRFLWVLRVVPHVLVTRNPPTSGCPSMPIRIILPFLERRCPQRWRVFSRTWHNISNIVPLHLQVLLACHTTSFLSASLTCFWRPSTFGANLIETQNSSECNLGTYLAYHPKQTGQISCTQRVQKS